MDADGVTILFSLASNYFQMSVSSEDSTPLVDREFPLPPEPEEEVVALPGLVPEVQELDSNTLLPSLFEII
jgi:hypothetical protein